MLVGVAYDKVACGAGAKIVSSLSSSASICEGLSFVVATVVVYVKPQAMALG